MMQQRSGGGSIAPAIAVLGGILAALGSISNWAKASAGSFSASAKGIAGWEGKITIVAGLVLIGAGVWALAGTAGSKKGIRGSALVGGLLATGVATYTALTPKDWAPVIESATSEIAKQLAIPVATARAAVQQAINRGDLKVSLAVGIYIVIAGGILGIVAAALAGMSRVSEVEAVPGAPPGGVPDAPGVAAPGAGLTGWSAPPPAPPAPAPPTPTETSPWAAPAPTPTGTSPWATSPPPEHEPPNPVAEEPGEAPGASQDPQPS